MKLNKTLIILSLLLVFCISLSAVSATEDVSINNNVATVESSVMNEEINAVGDEEIHNSSDIADDIYKLKDGTYFIEHDYQIDQTWIVKGHEVVIDGQGHTIYGNGKQAFYITGTGVTIQNLNFVDCSNSTLGGAIYFANGCNVRDCSFVNCSARSGGAIYFSDGGSVSGCSFVNCSAKQGGGAIYFNDDTPSLVSGCSFVNCSAESEGSAIYVWNLCRIDYCVFDNNKATYYSTICYHFDYAKSLVIDTFFCFQNNVTEFPSSLISGTEPYNWVVLNGYTSGDKYVVEFVRNDGSYLNESMPDYTARLVIGSEEKIITIHNNTFSCEYDPTKSYNIYSLISGNLLCSLPAQEPIPPIPPAHLKVILTVDDIKGISGSTVKVNVGVHDMLVTPINEGTVIISLNGKDYIAKVVDGIATFNVIIPSKEGIYSAKVSFNGEGTDYDNTTCDFTVTSVEDNNTEDINKSLVSNKINTMENCGNPLIALLIALISLPIIRRK